MNVQDIIITSVTAFLSAAIPWVVVIGIIEYSEYKRKAKNTNINKTARKLWLNN